MSRVAHENDLAGELADARDLAEHAAGIQHGLSDEDPVARALVDQNPLAKGIQVHVHDVADDEAGRDPSVLSRSPRRR
jgi:hypothetical protein